MFSSMFMKNKIRLIVYGLFGEGTLSKHYFKTNLSTLGHLGIEI